MNREQVVDMLNEFNHLGHNDWISRIFLTEEEYLAASTIEDKRLMKEAYAIALNLDKDHKRDDAIEWHLKQGLDIEVSKTRSLRYEIIPKKGKRHTFEIVTIKVTSMFSEGKKRVTRDVVDRQEVSQQEAWDFIQSQVGMFYHFNRDEDRLSLIVYED